MNLGFRFALVGIDDDKLWCRCRDVKGLFVDDPERDLWQVLEFVGCEIHVPLVEYSTGGREAWIQVLDTVGRAIGEYQIGVVTMIGSRASTADPLLRDVHMEVFVPGHPHPTAGVIWDRWRGGLPETRNLWAEYSTDERWGWLDVVRNRWCRDEHRHDLFMIRSRESFDLDGTYVTDEPGFYCALGEAINGPGGYFGAHPNGLRDCIVDSELQSLRLLWRRSEVLRKTQSEIFVHFFNFLETESVKVELG